MNISKKYLITFAISAAAGATAGLFATRKKPGLGGLFGAMAGLTAAAAATIAYERMKDRFDDGIDYYSKVSPMYRDFDDIEVE